MSTACLRMDLDVLPVLKFRISTSPKLCAYACVRLGPCTRKKRKLNHLKPHRVRTEHVCAEQLNSQCNLLGQRTQDSGHMFMANQFE
jgi:hypothetical protein